MSTLVLTNVAVLLGAAAVIGVAGYRLTGVAESIAAATGLGQTLLGGVLIGAITSLAGTATSITAAANGHPDIAFGNAVGGIAAQTTFLVIADACYRRANLEHAAAAEANLTQGTVLIFLLALVLFGMAAPEIAYLGIHPLSLILIVTYVLSVRLIEQSHRTPMWVPRHTDSTAEEPEPEEARRPVMAREWIHLTLLVSVVTAMGWLVARTGSTIAGSSGLSESVIGTLFTSITTSLPELVVAISAVRRGALNLALGDIFGGNTFDVLFLSLADVAYRPGSIYHVVEPVQLLWTVVCIAMTAIILLGLIRRQKRGFANIGFESSIAIALYLGAVVLLFASSN